MGLLDAGKEAAHSEAPERHSYSYPHYRHSFENIFGTHVAHSAANCASVNSKTSYITPVFPRHCCCCHFSKRCRPHPSAGIVHAVRQTLGSERNVTLRGSIAFMTLSKASGDAEFMKSVAKVWHLNFASVFFYLHSRPDKNNFCPQLLYRSDFNSNKIYSWILANLVL